MGFGDSSPDRLEHISLLCLIISYLLGTDLASSFAMLKFNLILKHFWDIDKKTKITDKR